jgi:hypothetical protein
MGNGSRHLDRGGRSRGNWWSVVADVASPPSLRRVRVSIGRMRRLLSTRARHSPMDRGGSVSGRERYPASDRAPGLNGVWNAPVRQRATSSVRIGECLAEHLAHHRSYGDTMGSHSQYQHTALFRLEVARRISPGKPSALSPPAFRQSKLCRRPARCARGTLAARFGHFVACSACFVGVRRERLALSVRQESAVRRADTGPVESLSEQRPTHKASF